MFDIAIQIEDDDWSRELPGLEELMVKICAAVAREVEASFQGEVCFVFTNNTKVADLNERYRGKSGPTNVLSFPAPAQPLLPAGAEGDRPLGDVVLALETVDSEAHQQGKTFPDHLTHLIVHGLLHLLGLDHESEDDALRMETKEIDVLKALGIPDPYEVHKNAMESLN